MFYLSHLCSIGGSGDVLSKLGRGELMHGGRWNGACKLTTERSEVHLATATLV